MAEPALELSGVEVVVFGWAGSEPRQLALFGRWYTRRGARLLTISADIPRALRTRRGFEHEGRAAAAEMLTRARLRPGSAPIIAHVFSNAGFWTFAATMVALRRTDEGRRALARLRAVVLDSAPGFHRDFGPRAYVRFSELALTPLFLGALGRPPAPRHPWLSPPLRGFLWFWYHMTPGQRADASRSLGLVAEMGDWPFLLLYSDADQVVPPEYVEAYALELGPRVAARVRFEGSGHVQHMIAHRARYFEAVADFLATRVGG